MIDRVMWTGTNRLEVAKFVRGASLTLDDIELVPGAVFIFREGGRFHYAQISDWIQKTLAGACRVLTPEEAADL